ncbi:MAG: TetR/AcrR family transcriptional regulator [Clostridia bacterium]|nr:TetR/AcrR family transcriptional regulator [Clostridia bacterium]
MNKSESKYFNTAVRFDKAFLELLQKKDFEYITVKEICEKAGVNRSTFYLHYETIGDLLEESLSYIQNQLFMRFQGKQSKVPNIKECSIKELKLITPDYLLPYLQFIQENQKLYKAAMARPVIFQAEKTFINMFHNVFEPILERFSVPADERYYRIIYYLTGISGIVGEWVNRGCQDSIDKIIAVICSCIPDME